MNYTTAIKPILLKIWLGWEKIAHFIGKINSYILLSLFYFLIIGPIALIKKTVKFFPPKPAKISYWVAIEQESEEDFERQF